MLSAGGDHERIAATSRGKSVSSPRLHSPRETNLLCACGSACTTIPPLEKPVMAAPLTSDQTMVAGLAFYATSSRHRIRRAGAANIWDAGIAG